jgi:hypothetical protein
MYDSHRRRATTLGLRPTSLAVGGTGRRISNTRRADMIVNKAKTSAPKQSKAVEQSPSRSPSPSPSTRKQTSFCNLATAAALRSVVQKEDNINAQGQRTVVPLHARWQESGNGS